MAVYSNKIIAVFLFLLLAKNSTSTSEKEVITPTEETSKEELVQSESKDGKLEIIKQIKKVNEDGSYTIGYEADDGSFKIESRDVLGNIKGTYGYIDDSGQIKRVSYSTSNTSEIIAKPEISPPSVVQRIPKLNRTTTYTTRRPSSTSYTTTQTTPTSTNNIIQRLQKLRSSISTTTTEKPHLNDVETTIKPPQLVYASSTPRILLQSRPILRSTPATQVQTQKSEGVLVRPELLATKPTELPLFKRLALKHPYVGDTKPTTEEPQIRSNILRRQLSQEKSEFDAEQHVFTLQQALGNDATDVYSSSVTTGTPRPLFTTTNRPRALLSSTTAPVIITRPTVKYAQNYQRNNLQDVESTVQEYAQETTTTEAATTPTPVPVVQIPANRAGNEPLVAIRHPYQRGTILVPLSQVQNSLVPIEMVEQHPHYRNDDQYVRETTPKPQTNVEPRPIYVRRLPPPQFRPIPVHVDENGYIREAAQPQNVVPTPYPLPVPITPPPQRYIQDEIDNDIDKISPPVSTKDFQKLLQQLIVRQTRLERISELTNTRRHPEYYQPRYRPVYRPVPVYVRPQIEAPQNNGPIQFVNEEVQRQRQYLQRQQQQELLRQQQNQQRQNEDIYNQRQQYVPDEQQSYIPMRRVARLLQSGPEERQHGNDVNEEYLPPDVREMLLLRMLQLAINPALPLGEDEITAEGTTQIPQYKKAPVRNVEILGEEGEEEKHHNVRTKRFRERQLEFFDDL